MFNDAADFLFFVATFALLCYNALDQFQFETKGVSGNEYSGIVCGSGGAAA